MTTNNNNQDREKRKRGEKRFGLREILMKWHGTRIKWDTQTG